MRRAGIDIGSRTIEVVISEEGRLIDWRQAETGYEPLKRVNDLLDGAACDRCAATGYGRKIAGATLDIPTVTEIKAYARGVSQLYPEASTILDIGGQDCKVIELFDNGKVKKFEMNDRCAAGTGKFLEIMSDSLGFKIDEFGTCALKAEKDIQISSMCTVFAESEVISLISKGENRNDIALALHMSVARRSVSMVKRIAGGGDLVFAGGVAKNTCMRHLIAELLQKDIIVPENPQIIGAYGASLCA